MINVLTADQSKIQSQLQFEITEIQPSLLHWHSDSKVFFPSLSTAEVDEEGCPFPVQSKASLQGSHKCVEQNQGTNMWGTYSLLSALKLSRTLASTSSPVIPSFPKAMGNLLFDSLLRKKTPQAVDQSISFITQTVSTASLFISTPKTNTQLLGIFKGISFIKLKTKCVMVWI